MLAALFLSTAAAVAAPQDDLAAPAAADGSARNGMEWLWGPDFTPDLNIYGNIFARKERKPIFDDEGNEVGDVARLRQVDVIFGAPLTEHVDTLVAASVLSTPANDEFNLEFEQAYIEMRSAPIVGEFPEGTSVLAGQFRTNVGRLNRERVYDLPQPTRPRSLTTFFGDNGYSQFGASGTTRWRITDHGALRLTLEYMDGGSQPLTDREGAFAGGTNSKISFETDEDVAHGIELGISRLHTRRADQDGRRAKVLIADALYRWRPEKSGPPVFWLGGEYVDAEVDRTAGGAVQPGGGYAWTQVRVSDQWAVGARYDVAQELEDDSLETRTYGLHLTRIESDNLRFSVSVERSQSDIELFDDVTRVFFEINFAAGTGPAKPFWMR